MTRIKTLLLGGTAAALLSASVYAQTAPTPPASASPPAPTEAGALYDPAQLPAFKGQVQLFTLTPRGDIDGMILTDGTEVKTPPHLSTEIAFTVKPGDAVTIHGLKAASLPLVRATSITADASGKTIVDNGPEGRGGPDRGGPQLPPPPPPPLADNGPDGQNGPGRADLPLPPPPPPSAGRLQEPLGTPGSVNNKITGKIRMALHGPRGDVNGVLFENGTMLRMPPPEAERFASMLQPGQTIVARGFTLSSPIGTLVDVTAIGPSSDQLVPIAPDRGGKRGPKGPPPV